MKESIIQEKSYSFAIKIIDLYKFLCYQRKEYVMSKQILKSGTSIGANIEEASGGHSKKDFLSKLTIAYKEGRETRYWLRLLKDVNMISGTEFNSLLKDCEEILKIIGAIQRTLKNNL